MIETDLAVAHLLTGEVLKGSAVGFFPNKPSFQLKPADGGNPVDVQCDQLKALFFVRNLTGDPRRQDLRGFVAGPAVTTNGNRIAVHFKDGELLTGYSMNYGPGKDSFVVFPADPRSNNLRIYVRAAATQKVYSGPAATAVVVKMLKTGKAS